MRCLATEEKSYITTEGVTLPCTQQFWKFVKLLGRKINISGWTKYRGDMRPPDIAYYDDWKGIEIIYHVAPLLTEEETRRLIANDIAYIIFLEEGLDEFDPSHVGEFGDVPHLFVIVQPVKDKYRIAFFTKKSIIPHHPYTPQELLEPYQTKDIVLTKLHNGLVMTNYCPPMSWLFYKPRQETLLNITSKYLPHHDYSCKPILLTSLMIIGSILLLGLLLMAYIGF